MTHSLLRWLPAVLVLMCSSTLAADDPKKVDVSVVFLTDMNVVEVDVDVEPLAAWVKPIIQAVESQFRDETRRRTVIVQVTLRPKGKAEVLVAGSPATTDEETGTLLKAADPAGAPRAKVVDCSFRVVAQINGGQPDEGFPPTHILETPDERRIAEFRVADTPKRLAIMRRWSRQEAIPVLAAFAAHADPKFAGVRDLGKAIGGLDPGKPVGVAAVTDRSHDYWRAMLEMSPGIPLVPAIRVALHVADGEIDRARRVAQAVVPFDANKSGPSRILGDLRMMMDLFYKDLEARIGEGVKLHDQGRFADALKVYDAVLRDYPGSAWAHYERFHTRRSAAMARGASVDESHADWPEARAAILAADPLYPTLAVASGAEEMYRLVRRVEINSLFKDRTKRARDIVKYADISLDLGEYGFAAMLYWDALTAIKPDDYDHRNLLEYFLYCLDELGVKDIKDNFRGDHAAEFAKIKAERLRLKEENPAFRKGVKSPEAGAKPANG